MFIFTIFLCVALVQALWNPYDSPENGGMLVLDSRLKSVVTQGPSIAFGSFIWGFYGRSVDAKFKYREVFTNILGIRVQATAPNRTIVISCENDQDEVVGQASHFAFPDTDSTSAGGVELHFRMKFHRSNQRYSIDVRDSDVTPFLHVCDVNRSPPFAASTSLAYQFNYTTRGDRTMYVIRSAFVSFLKNLKIGKKIEILKLNYVLLNFLFLFI